MGGIQETTTEISFPFSSPFPGSLLLAKLGYDLLSEVMLLNLRLPYICTCWKVDCLSERVLLCHELSWYVTKCHNVKWNIFDDQRISWNITNHHYLSPNVIKCHHVKWNNVTFSDSWWCLMIFKYFSWKNYEFYHDISWYISDYHDMSPSIWER